MGELVELKKGEVSVDVKFELGKVVLTSKYDGKGADAEVKLAVDSEYFIAKLKEAIPGQVDDVVLGLLAAALKKV